MHACTPQDYVKWRGQLFQHFLRALVDDSAPVRALAEFLLADTLCNKVGGAAGREHPLRPCMPAIQHALQHGGGAPLGGNTP
jgi:hypothetical protein